jgi:hypothetical protein
MTSPLYQEGAARKFIGIGLTVGFCPVQGRIRHFWRWHRGVFSRSVAGRLKSSPLLIRLLAYHKLLGYERFSSQIYITSANPFGVD